MKCKQLPHILLLTLLLHGCSSFPRYVISNNSDEIIVINYSYPAGSDKEGNRHVCPIKQAFPETTLDKLTNDSISWQKLSADKYVFNDRHCSLKIAIIADASVTVATQDPFRGKMPARSLVDSDLIRLNIHNEKRNVLLIGSEVFKRFEQKTEKLYVYNFP